MNPWSLFPGMITWTEIEFQNYIRLPLETLNHFGIQIEDLLLSVRGSKYGLGMITRGPIITEAKYHHDLKIFL